MCSKAFARIASLVRRNVEGWSTAKTTPASSSQWVLKAVFYEDQCYPEPFLSGRLQNRTKVLSEALHIRMGFGLYFPKSLSLQSNKDASDGNDVACSCPNFAFFFLKIFHKIDEREDDGIAAKAHLLRNEAAARPPPFSPSWPNALLATRQT